MTICQFCRKDKEVVHNCQWAENYGVLIGSVTYNAIPNGPEECIECGVGPGQYHHPGCSHEICPSCGGILMDCYGVECESDE